MVGKASCPDIRSRTKCHCHRGMRHGTERVTTTRIMAERARTTATTQRLQAIHPRRMLTRAVTVSLAAAMGFPQLGRP
jgi:hypothetical protein